MATLAVTTITRAGIDLATAVAADAGLSDTFANTGKEMFYVKNGGGGSITVTLVFQSGATVDGVAPTNKTVTVANGISKVIGPFPVAYYNDANNRVVISYSGVTSVTVLPFTAGI